MKDLYKYFSPIVANPISRERYLEILPSRDLRPYVKCYWGSFERFKDENTIDNNGKVIPDGCMDIIFDFNYSKEIFKVSFCGINDRTFKVEGDATGDILTTFAIRFHFWSARVFSDMPLREIKNKLVVAEEFFRGIESDLVENLMGSRDIYQRIGVVEKYLRNRLYWVMGRDDDFLNAVYYMSKHKGTKGINEVLNYSTVSNRKLERVFKENIGISPKGMSGIIRFQNSWRDIYYSKEMKSQDISFIYGYNSQAHFISDFKKYYNDTPVRAWKEKENVAFLKYKKGNL